MLDTKCDFSIVLQSYRHLDALRMHGVYRDVPDAGQALADLLCRGKFAVII